MENTTNILVKCPTRERPHKFMATLIKYITMANNNKNIHYLVTLDRDDPKLPEYKQIIVKLQAKYANITAVIGESTGKISAVNRDMDVISNWDIVVLYSDDMTCQLQGWDDRIRSLMREWFRAFFDGVLWFNDGFNTAINCMPIMGRKAYDKFGYIYNTEYQSLFCDNEFTEVWQQLKKQVKLPETLFLHEHYARSSKYHHTMDALMKKNESFYSADEKVYNRRKATNFDLPKAA